MRHDLFFTSVVKNGHQLNLLSTAYIIVILTRWSALYWCGKLKRLRFNLQIKNQNQNPLCLL